MPTLPEYDRETADRLAGEGGWAVASDGPHHRRVVASPEPRSIVELTTLRLLVEVGVLVVCVGAGGIPALADARAILQRRRGTRVAASDRFTRGELDAERET